ncbi:MAG: aminopeptidase [Thermoleophilaceae bacterium]|nr:aminopeptidase [Thermoleophilaceae bacterium]
MRHEDLATRLAELAVRFGANVQPGQVVSVSSEPGKETLARAVAEAAYRAGARFVDVTTFDVHVKRARLLHADEDTLDYVPPWYGERVLALSREGAAHIALTGPVEPQLLNDLDPARVGRDNLPSIAEWARVVGERTVNWTAVPCPTAQWALLVFPDLDPAAALDRLWEEVARCCRLDEPDPPAAWAARMGRLRRVAGVLNERRFDALHYEGPGTDLTVGLLPTSEWLFAEFSRVDGLRHMPNIPSEEIFTSPDPARADGVIRSTKPLVRAGTLIRDLEVELRGGRVVRVEASSGGEALRATLETDEGAARLGEVALVDSDSRVGALGTVFYDTLLDENAVSHIALGNGFPFAVGANEHERVNRSAIHIDFMVGGDELTVSGVTAAGERVPILVGGRWRI